MWAYRRGGVLELGVRRSSAGGIVGLFGTDNSEVDAKHDGKDEHARSWRMLR